MKRRDTFNSLQRVRGFTLVELMIAILIGLFLTAGLLTLVQAMKRSTTSQSGLSQLQDNERLAMSLIASVVQSSGYFPNPLTNTAATMFTVTAVAPIFAAGQFMTGTHAAAVPGDTLSLRYSTAGGDNVLNCAGGKSPLGTPKTWTATLSIDGNKNLQCVLFDGTTTTTVQLVSGVTNLQVLYGVQTNASALYNSADTYLTATAMTTAYWGAVRSVKVTVSFNNPLVSPTGALQAGQTTVQGNAGATIPFTRVITVMNATGVDT